MPMPIFRPVLAIAAALAVGACSSYDSRGYGYSGVRVGYSDYSYPYYGWYEDYYYPGTGYYVYDRRGERHRWSDRHRHYWEGRRHGRSYRENWSGYQHRDKWRENRRELRKDRREARREWRQERREDRREWRQERREDRRDWRQNNRGDRDRHHDRSRRR